MIIKSISIKNFKSFGNNTQKVTFNTKEGELILLTGGNGAGKSSLQESFDFSIFGIVRGKKAKRVPLNALPNRINKNTEVEIEFMNNFGNDIKLKKSLEPTSAQFYENDEDITRQFKKLSAEEREKVIGFNFETYKSFVSMSVSDFANFINLTPNDKRKIINKLFNLQELDNYLSIVKDIIKNDLSGVEKNIILTRSNLDTIGNYEQNIKNIKKSGLIDKEVETKTLKTELNSKREPYIKLKERNTQIIEELKNIQNKLQDFENQKNLITQELLEEKLELKNTNEKIEVYNSGICPVCDTTLNDNEHKHNLKSIENNKKEIIKKLITKNTKRDNITLETTKLSNQKDSKIKERNNNSIKYNSLVYELKLINKKLGKLKEKEDYTSIDEIEKSISEIVEKNTEHKKIIHKLENNIKTYKDLQDIFSAKGIRKTIIKNIITPLNVYLKDILDEFDSPYSVKLDEEFNSIIYERFNEINSETLSVGESKKINVAIALSYLKLILKVRKLNILFLDEIFSSMHPRNVELALKILQDFAKEYKINIIIVDPEVYFNETSAIGLHHFNRIIKVKKKMNFSFIEIDHQ
jgi:DNA repair exonuclease SbcCD ATPase subunit